MLEALKNTAIGWAIWLGGLVFIFAADFSLRIIREDIFDIGIDRSITSILLVLIAMPAAVFLFRAAKSQSLWARVILVLAQGFVGYCAAIFLSIFYSCSIGAGCL